MQERDSSSHSVHEQYEVIIIGSGIRAKSIHKSACENAGLKYRLIPGRSFSEQDALTSKVWIVCVPPQFRRGIYKKIKKSQVRSGPLQGFRILAETPSTFSEIYYSLIKGFKINIAESANANFSHDFEWKNLTSISYEDKRFGTDHSYAVFYRVFGVSKGIFLLLSRRVYLSTNKSDKASITLSDRDSTKKLEISAQQRIENEISYLSKGLTNLVDGRNFEPITRPLSNFLLKRLFLLLAKKISVADA